MVLGRPRKVDKYVCAGCYKGGLNCAGLKCTVSRSLLNPRLVQTSPRDSGCHCCGQTAVSSCVHCGRRHFCAEHFEGVCRHCQDQHCDACEDLWTLRLPECEPLGDWSIQDHLQLAVALEGLRQKVVTKALLKIDKDTLSPTLDAGEASVLAVPTEEERDWILHKYRLPRPVSECVEYLNLADRHIRQDRKAYLSYAIRRIVYSKLDKRPLFLWPSSLELLVRSVYPRLHYRYSLPATLDKLTPEFAALLEAETEEAIRDCMVHRHRLFDFTPGAYSFNRFENKLVDDGHIHGQLAELWYLCRYRAQYVRGRCAVPAPHTMRQPYGGSYSFVRGRRPVASVHNSPGGDSESTR